MSCIKVHCDSGTNLKMEEEYLVEHSLSTLLHLSGSSRQSIPKKGTSGGQV